MMVIILVILFTTLLAWVAYYYVTDYSEQRNIRRLQDLGYSLQNEIILAYTVEPGYTRTVRVPQYLGNEVVNISNTANDIILEHQGSEIAFRIPAISGSFSTGENTIQKLADGSVVVS